MKLQIDFDNKTITLDSQVEVLKLMSKLHTMIPDLEGWKLNSSKFENWYNPIIIDTRQPDWWPSNPCYINNPVFGGIDVTGNAIDVTGNAGAPVDTQLPLGVVNYELNG